MPQLEVKCTVTDCFFHKEENICGAEKIEINMNPQSVAKGDTEFASDFDPKSLKEEAKQSIDTCCNTFIHKKDAMN